MNEQAILDQALKLSSARREKVAEALLGSIKRPSQRHLEALWAQEAESRVDGFLAGKIKAVSGPKVLSYRQTK